jgi:hypothetical protein
MSPEMTLFRKEDLSLYYYIKDIVLCNFLEQEENITLSLMEALSSTTTYVYEALTEMVPNPVERGRGWVYLDTVSGTTCPTFAAATEQINRVTVYDSLGTTISDSEYLIDYLDGRVITSGTVTPSTVDYFWNYVSVVDEWAAIEAADPPVIVIDMHGTDKGGYQLGSGVKVTRKVDIHIFASSTAERNDLVDTIFNGLYLKSFPLYDFPQGGVLDYDGLFYGRRNNMDKSATPFDDTTVSGIIGRMEFNKVTSRHINLPLVMSRGRNEVLLSDLNAYRSKISFEVNYYTESVLIN